MFFKQEKDWKRRKSREIEPRFGWGDDLKDGKSACLIKDWSNKRMGNEGS